MLHDHILNFTLKNINIFEKVYNGGKSRFLKINILYGIILHLKIFLINSFYFLTISVLLSWFNVEFLK